MKRFASVVPGLCLGLLAAIVAASAAFADHLTLTSDEFKDGDYLGSEPGSAARVRTCRRP
jgi:hypothetical protein